MPVAAVPVRPTSSPFYFAMLGVLALALLRVLVRPRSKLGLMLFSIRDDEDRARGRRRPTTGREAGRVRA